MPQIQYSPIAEAPAFTLPTVAQLGWSPSLPQAPNVRYASRATWRQAAMTTADQTTGANVFAIEKWTVTPGAAFEGPDNPELTAPRRARPQGPSLVLTQVIANSVILGWGVEIPDGPLPRTPLRSTIQTSTLSLEPWAMPDGWAPSYPERTLRAKVSPPSTTTQPIALEQLAVPPVAWLPQLVDRASRARGLVEYPAVAHTGRDLAAVATTIEWLPTLVEAARRAARLTTYPATASTLALEQLTIPPVSWQPRLVDFARAAKGLVTHPPLSETIAHFSVAPPTAWLPLYPDRAVRAPRLPEYPAFALTVSPEGFVIPALSWAPQKIDRAVRAKGLVEYPVLSLAPGLIVAAAPTLSWSPAKSDRPVRARGVADHPAFAFGLGLEQWTVPALSWSFARGERPVRSVRPAEYAATSHTAITIITAPALAAVVAPVRHPIPDRRIMTWPTLSWGIVTRPEAPVLSWQGSAPARVWAARLPVADLPWLFGRGDSSTEGFRLRATVQITQQGLWTVAIGPALSATAAITQRSAHGVTVTQRDASVVVITQRITSTEEL